MAVAAARHTLQPTASVSLAPTRNTYVQATQGPTAIQQGPTATQATSAAATRCQTAVQAMSAIATHQGLTAILQGLAAQETSATAMSAQTLRRPEVTVLQQGQAAAI